MLVTLSNRQAVESAVAHWRDAFGLAVLLTGDRTAAEDLCQEALLRITTMRREVDRPEAVRPLFLRIIRNLAVSEGRRPRATPLEGPVVDDTARDPAAEACHQESLSAVRAALDGLDPTWREVLYLRDGVGLSYAEIAGVVDRTVDVVRVTLHRARNRIRARLNGKLEERNPS